MVNMRGFVVRKLIYVLITLFAIIAFNFFLFRVMPGDPARVLVPRASPELVEIIRAEFHLDDPIHIQFIEYFKQTFHGDFGISTGKWKGAPVIDGLGAPIINTVLLVGIGSFFAIVLGIALGRFAAWRRGKPADTVGMAFALTFYSMPRFLFALVMVMIFAGSLGWFPLRGAYADNYRELPLLNQIASRAYHLVLPVTAFTVEVMAEYALIMRNSLTDVLTEDYIVTARAKGISNKMILKDHAMRNAMLPVVTVAAISVGWVLGGDIMVEIVFGYQGMGMLTWDAVLSRDFPLLQALFLLMAIAVLAANLIADIIYMYLDPRVTV
jgi:peptide/nickel transport system permease protein